MVRSVGRPGADCPWGPCKFPKKRDDDRCGRAYLPGTSRETSASLALEPHMRAIVFSSLCFLAASVFPRAALAVKSRELYTSASHPFGRFEASISYPHGDGVVGAYFLWKAGS